MITYELVSWDTYYNDPSRAALWAEHYEELCRANRSAKPMSPDVPFFQILDQRGMLQILIVRENGAMVGYCLVIVKRHTHYDVLAGIEDSYFLRKTSRRGMTGVRLITKSLLALKARGVKEVYFMSKEFMGLDKVMERVGFELDSKCWKIWIGPQAPAGG